MDAVVLLPRNQIPKTQLQRRSVLPDAQVVVVAAALLHRVIRSQLSRQVTHMARIRKVTRVRMAQNLQRVGDTKRMSPKLLKARGIRSMDPKLIRTRGTRIMDQTVQRVRDIKLMDPKLLRAKVMDTKLLRVKDIRLMDPNLPRARVQNM